MPILSVIGLLRQIVRVCLYRPARRATPPATPLVRHTPPSRSILSTSLAASCATLRTLNSDLRSRLRNAARGRSEWNKLEENPLLFLLEITSRVDYRLINSKRVSIIVDKSIWILAREVSLGELWERIELLGSGQNERSVRPPFNHTREYAQVEMDGSGCKRNRPTIDAKSETRLWTMAVE